MRLSRVQVRAAALSPKRITAESELIDKWNLQTYVESAFTEAPL